MNIFKNIKSGIKATTPKEKKVVKGQDLPVISRILKNFAMDKDKGVIGGYNNSFPLSTATQGNVYFLPATGKYYYCQTSYNGTQISAPNSNFVEISVLANHDRLNNLFGNPKKVITKYIIVTSTEQLFDLEIDMNNINFLIFYSFERSGSTSRTPVTLITPKMLDKKLVSTISGSGGGEPANFHILMYSFTKEGIFNISQSIQSSNGLKGENPIYLNIEIY